MKKTYKQIYKETTKVIGSKAKYSKKEVNNYLNEAINRLSNSYADEMNRQLFAPLPMFEKPKKYYIVPRLIINIPYLKFDREYDSEWGEGRRGLFLEWKEIRIGSKKEINKNYKEEMKRWHPNRTIKFSRYQAIK